MQIETAVEIQRAYKKLTSGEVPFSKKNMCDILVPLRDKYGLTDRQVLQVARNELSLEEIANLKVKCEPLSLDELKTMTGKPVWVQVMDHDVFSNPEDDFDGWGMCRTSWIRIWDAKRADLVHVDYHFEDYGKEWLAYSQEPEVCV